MTGRQQNLIPHHQRPGKPDAAPEADFNRPYVEHVSPRAIGERHLFRVDRLELQLDLYSAKRAITVAG